MKTAFCKLSWIPEVPRETENGTSGSATTRPRSHTSCSALLGYSNLSGMFGQLERKNLYDSDIRRPASPTVIKQVRDENFVWC